MSCRILIVEDEQEIRQGIRHMTNWSYYGFEIVGEASNGKQALEVIRKLRPHIILTDIRMPEMDGVQLTKTIQVQYPDIKVIVLSGYSDYEYVRTCFRYGAVDYVLKPMLKPADMLEILKKTAMGIADLELQMDEQLNADSALRLLLGGTPFNQAADLQVLFSGTSFKLMAMNFAFVFGRAQDMKQCLSLFRETVKQSLPDSMATVVVFDNHILVALIPVSDTAEDAEDEVVRDIANQMANYLGDSFWICSERIGSPEDISAVWKNEIVKRLNQRFYYPQRHLVKSLDYKCRLESPAWDKEQFERLLKDEEFEKALKHLKQYVAMVTHRKSMEEFELKAMVQNAFYQVLSRLEAAGADSSAITTMRRDFIIQISNVSFARELHETLDVLAKMVIAYPIERGKKKKESIAEYIENNYAQELTLAGLAREFNYNYQYLSSYFQKHYQKSFTEYLNMVRIQKAKQLLKKGEISISEVATSVGYTDNSYFSRVFKKSMGISPMTYRTQAEKGDGGE